MRLLTFANRRTKAGKVRRAPGRKVAERPNVRHRARPVQSKSVPMHVVMRAKKGLPSFRREMLVRAFEKAFRTTRREDFRIVEYSVRDTHLHLIVEADDKDALARGMKSFSVRANRLFNTASERKRGQVWGDRYHRRGWRSRRREGPADKTRPTDDAQTYLLRVAWHKHHPLIHPAETPRPA